MGGLTVSWLSLRWLLWVGCLALGWSIPTSDNVGKGPHWEGAEHTAWDRGMGRRFTIQTSSPSLTSITVPSGTSTGNSASATLSLIVVVDSADQPSGFLNITTPTGFVGYQASITFASSSTSNWTGTASVPLNYYMPVGTYVVSGVYLSNSAGVTTAVRTDSFQVSTVYTASTYPSLQLCSTGNVGFTSFVPKAGLSATRVSCCSGSLPCSLGGSSTQVFGVGVLQLISPTVAIDSLTINVTQLLTFNGTSTVSFTNQGDLQVASGAAVTQSGSTALTFQGCATGTGFALNPGANMTPTGSVSMNTPFMHEGVYTVPSSSTLSSSCDFSMAVASAQVSVRQSSSLVITGAATCTAGNISGAGNLLVQSGNFSSTGCFVNTNQVMVSGSTGSSRRIGRSASTGTLATFCGRWPTTVVSGNAVLSIPPCSSACPCSVVELRRRVAVVVGNLSIAVGSTLSFDISSGNLTDHGCLDVTGTFSVQGNISIKLGGNLGASTVTKTICLVRSGQSGCDASFISSISWTNAPSNYSVSAGCTRVAGTLSTLVALTLTWTGPLTTYGRESPNTALAWALVAIALLLLFSLCTVVIVKIIRRPTLPSHSGLFEEQDGQVASVLQEADPFIPPLTQPVKTTPRSSA